jgi:hypothetical protein
MLTHKNIMHEPLTELFNDSKLLILDFDEIPETAKPEENISTYFKICEAHGIDPKLPSSRQLFNDTLSEKSKYRYLVSRYGEDRIKMLAGSVIAQENRTLHLGVDVFCQKLEIVYAPCDGAIITSGREFDDHSFGNYLILKPSASNIPYIFFGHLDDSRITLGEIQAGNAIARIGDYINNDNGGWSRHLHIQMLQSLPEDGIAPPGYTSKVDFPLVSSKYPDPMVFFPKWHINGPLDFK